MKLLKFGGSSVGSPDRITRVKEIIARSQKESGEIAVVVSAFQGVTDELISMGWLAARGDDIYRDVFKKLEERHFQAARELIPAKDQSSTFVNLKLWLNELSETLQGVFLLKELSKRTLDSISSYGERFSAYIIAASIQGEGTQCEFLDTRQIVKTDRNFGSAKVKYDETNKLVREYFETHRSLQIATGFIGSTDEGDTTTLGRGGSDYTASILGAALSASEIEIWTDVDGMMTADPRKVPKAFPLERMTYEEAMELCHFGAKVIYPPTLQPAFNKGIPIRIRNTFHPEFPGTIIADGDASQRYMVTGISSIDDIALLRIEGSGMVGVAGIAMRLFGALARNQISVILITQASSEHTICIAINPRDADEAKRVIEEEFSLEIKTNLINEPIVERERSIVSVVGENMRNTPGIAGRLFQALGRNGINIVAIAQGSSELNISVVISRPDEAKALNALHDQFFLSGTKSLHVFLAGTGLIGGTLLRQIEEHSKYLRKNLALDLKLIGVTSSRKMSFNERGIEFSQWKEALELTPEAGNIVEFVQKMKRLNLPNSIFVDCTASEEVVKQYPEILDASIAIVTPNKKGQSGSNEFYTELKRISAKRGVEFLFETSVGAGLPVISTLNDLRKSGDEVFKIEAVLSGTLSFIFNSYQGIEPFSQIVREAKERGFTEPDPRDDLNGIDVARKLLILAREAGFALEMSDISVESLVPEKAMKARSVEEFFKILAEFDAAYEQRRQNAARNNCKLCYVARFEKGAARLVLEEMSPTHPFYGLSGSDNIISFTTKRYFERPLVVKGPGAGAEVTAAGVFADLIRISQYRNYEQAL